MRLEYVLASLIVMITLFATNVEVHQKQSNTEEKVRELEFRDTRFIEVTTQKREGVAYAAYGIRENGLLTLEKLFYSNAEIRRMSADKALYKNRMIHLEGNVTLYGTKGFRFFTEEADYYRKTEVLHVTAPFSAYMDKNEIKGEMLQYNMLTENIYAKKIRATILMAKKDDMAWEGDKK